MPGMTDAAALHLNLWKKRLGAVPPWVWEKTELRSLVLADNELAEVPEAGLPPVTAHM